MARRRRPPYRDGELALFYGAVERGEPDDVVVQGVRAPTAVTVPS